MNNRIILSIDQGTTGSRVFFFNQSGDVINSEYKEFTQHFPRPGWVEHDALEIWSGIKNLISEGLKNSNINSSQISAIGITNQRETVVIWDRKTGMPVHNAIVWQCRRTAEICDDLKKKGHAELIHKKTGLFIDAYFSGTKIKWLLENVEGIKKRALNGELAAGTIDSWILYNLTGEHKTEYTNASRTMLYNIQEKKWDKELLDILDVPKSLLPEVSKSRSEFGHTKGIEVLPDGIPVLAMAGDQQAALFGQLCTEPNQAKNTYGTGCFLLCNTGDKFILSKSGLVTTLACDADGNPVYALEGSIFIGGAVIQWLRDYMKFFADASETDEIIDEVKDEEDDLVFVPAFVGLGAPHWDMKARGAIFGITRDTSPARIIRAAVKSIALQTMDVITAMEKDTGQKIEILKVDGGAAFNLFLLKYQAGLLNRPVERPHNLDTTALGAAYLAGLEAGIWKDLSELKKLQTENITVKPDMNDEERKKEIKLWNKAVDRAKNWVD